MKRLFVIAWILVLICAAPAVFAKPNLIGGGVIAKGQCTFHNTEGYCYLVMKDGELYIALLDVLGEHSIFQVKEMPDDGHILDKHVSLLWTRGDA